MDQNAQNFISSSQELRKSMNEKDRKLIFVITFVIIVMISLIYIAFYICLTYPFEILFLIVLAYIYNYVKHHNMIKVS